jgi:hypothetical protein
MSVQVDIWLRGSDVATTATIEGVTRSPVSWTDDDVRQVLEEMLRVMHRLKHPAESEFPITLCGLRGTASAKRGRRTREPLRRHRSWQVRTGEGHCGRS